MSATRTPRTEDGNCSACGHTLAEHYRDVCGVARCLVIEMHFQGPSGKGHLQRCPCAEFAMPPAKE